MQEGRWTRPRLVLLAVMALAGWALLTLALSHAEYGSPFEQARRPWFYRPFTLWCWLAGTALIAPSLWWVYRHLDRSRWGVPSWESHEQHEETSRLTVAVFWLTAAAVGLATWNWLRYGHWSVPLTIVLAVPVIGGAVLLYLTMPENLSENVSWPRVAGLVALFALIVFIGYRYFFGAVDAFGRRTGWYPALFVILGAALAHVMTYRWRWIIRAGLTLAVALTALSGWLYVYGPNALKMNPRTAQSVFQNPYYLSLFSWLAALVILVVFFYLDRTQPRRSWALKKWEFIFIAALTLCAGALRVWDTANIPPEFHVDEANEGIAALRILRWNKPDGQPDPFDRGAFHHNNLPYHLFAAGLLIFNDRIAALRIVTALSGALAVPLLYLLVREMFGRFAAVLSSAFLCTAYMAIHFSRMGLGNAHAVPFTIAAVFLLWRAMHPQARPRDFMWFGLILALSQYSLPAIKVLVIFLAMFILYMLFTRPRQVLAPIQGWSVALLAILVAWTPLLSNYHRTNFEGLTKRAGEVVIWQSLERVRPEMFPNYPHRLFWELPNLPKATRAGFSQFFVIFPCMFFGGDTSGQFHYQRGFLDFWTGVLFLGGMTFSFLSFHRPKYALLNFWYWSTLVLGGALTIDPPFSPRLVPLIPVLAIWPGLMLAKTAHHFAEAISWPIWLTVIAVQPFRSLTRWLRNRAGHHLPHLTGSAVGVFFVKAVRATHGTFADTHRYLKRIGRSLWLHSGIAALVTSIAIVVCIAGYNFHLYFLDYVPNENAVLGFSMTTLARHFIGRLDPARVKIVIVDSAWIPAGSPIFRYLIPNHELEDYRPLQGYLPFRQPVQKDIIFVAPMYQEKFLRHQPPFFYPGGEFGLIERNQKPLYVTYSISREQVNEVYDTLVKHHRMPPPPEPPKPPPEPILRQVVRPIERSALPEGALAIERAFPGWKVVAVGNDSRVGVSAGEAGRSRSIVLHPLAREHPAVIEWQGTIPKTGRTLLLFDAASHPPAREADTCLRVYVNELNILDKVLGPWTYAESPWQKFEIDISLHARGQVKVQIWAVATGWYYEFLHLSDLRIIHIPEDDALAQPQGASAADDRSKGDEAQ